MLYCQKLPDGVAMERTCTKCSKTLPATTEFFYKNSGGKYGLTPRCKACVNEDNALSHKKRLEADPERIREQANKRSRKHYRSHLEKCRETARKSAAKARLDPEKYLKIQARKRADGAGLSPEEIESIRLSQDNKCAICSAPDPTDLDHCHKTGQIRFLLCKHCNRGLGAFRDDPSLMRRAADLLEQLNDRKSTGTSQSSTYQEYGG